MLAPPVIRRTDQEAENYEELDAPVPRIEGCSWIADDRQMMELWKFTLFLDRQYNSRDEIDWTSLLPSDNVTRWMALDLPGKRLQIEPTAAESDPAKPAPRRP